MPICDYRSTAEKFLQQTSSRLHPSCDFQQWSRVRCTDKAALSEARQQHLFSNADRGRHADWKTIQTRSCHTSVPPKRKGKWG
jgi:hypothetical protein